MKAAENTEKTNEKRNLLNKLEKLYETKSSLTKRIFQLRATEERMLLEMQFNDIEIAILEFQNELNILLEAIQNCESEEELNKVKLIRGALINKKDRISKLIGVNWLGFENIQKMLKDLLQQVEQTWNQITQQLEISFHSLINSMRLEIVKRLIAKASTIHVAKLFSLLKFKEESELVNYLLSINVNFQLKNEEISFKSQKIFEFDMKSLEHYAENFSIKCASHLQRVSLKEAITSNWKICKVCLGNFCPICSSAFKICPNFGKNEHEFSPAGLPLEELLMIFESLNINSSKIQNFKPEIKISNQKVLIIE